MAVVELKGLAKIFPAPGGKKVTALQNLSLRMENGEFLAVLGPSGSGKSTLLRLIAGLEEPSAGSLAIGGADMRGVAPGDRSVAMVFQTDALYPHMTVAENLSFGLKLRKADKAESARRAREMATTLGLESMLDRLPETLSGGQRQRVSLGRAMVLRPEVFLLDEPLSHLDPLARAQMRREMARLLRSTGAAIIYVTHDQTEAMALADRVAVLRDGVIQQTGAPMDLYRHPANVFVGGFLGTPPMSFLRGTLREDGSQFTFASKEDPASKLSWPREEIPMGAALAGRELALGIRPEHVLIAPLETTGLRAQIDLREPMGSETWVHLRAGMWQFTARAAPDFSPLAGQIVSVRFAASGLRFFDPATGSAIA